MPVEIAQEGCSRFQKLSMKEQLQGCKLSNMLETKRRKKNECIEFKERKF